MSTRPASATHHSRVTALVMAKAPVPGQVKTRLAAEIGPTAAAELAALALLDTLEVCAAAFGSHRCSLALAGELAGAVHGESIRRALSQWTVRGQRGDTFGDRLATAHAAMSGPVLQIGMDTPQVGVAELWAAEAALRRADGVLGPATDGGWWLLGLRDPRAAAVLSSVPMSTPHTGGRTKAALLRRGLSIIAVDELEDVDDLTAADAVAALAPHTRFGRAWMAHRWAGR